MRLPLAPLPLLLIVFAVVLLVGVYTSPLTKIRVLRVDGVPSWDRERVRALLRAYEDVPALRINPLQVEREVESHPAVLRSDFRRNVFGRARLEVAYHRAIASFERSGSKFGISASGAVFPLSGRAPNLTVEEKLMETHPNLSVFDRRRLGGVLDLAAKVQQKLPSLRGKLSLLASGGLALTTAEGARVEFGDRERLDEKVSVLARALEQNPNLLRQARTVNLVVPSRPSVRWR